jgi:hypothetical protein
MSATFPVNPVAIVVLVVIPEGNLRFVSLAS